MESGFNACYHLISSQIKSDKIWYFCSYSFNSFVLSNSGAISFVFKELSAILFFFGWIRKEDPGDLPLEIIGFIKP